MAVDKVLILCQYLTILKQNTMLQRIQTVYLFLVLVFAVLFLSFPMATLQAGVESFIVKPWGIVPSGTLDVEGYFSVLGIVCLVLAFVIMILSVYTTYKFKQRLLQIRLGKINLFLHMILVVSAFFYLDGIRKGLDASFSYGLAVIFPLLSMVMIFMANRAIRRDEELVRSADRLR